MCKSLLGRTGDDLGFEFVVYSCAIYPPFSRDSHVLVSNLSENALRQVGPLLLDSTGPLHGCAIRNSSPILWENISHLGGDNFWQILSASGLRFGCSFPVWSAGGCIGMVSFARRSEPLAEREFALKHHHLQIAASRFHEMYSGCSDSVRAVGVTLNEVAVLRWTGEGKTSQEIGRIMGLAERTVNFHINKALIKLNVVNKAQGAVKAALLGLLY